MPLNTRLTRVWREVRRWRGGGDAPLSVEPDLDPGDLRRLSAEIDAVIETRGGLAGSRRRARTVGLTYATLSQTGRQRFFEHLATRHDRDHEAVDRAIDAVQAATEPADRRAAESELRRVLRPGHETLLRRLAGQDGGLDFLVKLRADLLPHRRSSPELAALDAELRQILENWFDVGLLELVRLTWDTSASLLERLIEYEAVHAIESWDDLKRRLGPRRRCYAFLHPGMPDDPLIFVEVALTQGIPDRLDPLLEPVTAAEAAAGGKAQPSEDRTDTAVFYSISNCHAGLAGVSLGDFLIKSVAEELSAELSNLRTFVTLSPLPGFRTWLGDLLGDEDARRELAIPMTQPDPPAGSEEDGDRDGEERTWAAIRDLLDGERPGRDSPDLERLRPVLAHLAARYVSSARPDARAVDPVAHFHLSNGARVERLNWMANPSPTGWERSLGLMVNYRYDLSTIEENHDAYVGSGRITLGDDVRDLVEARSTDNRRRWR